MDMLQNRTYVIGGAVLALALVVGGGWYWYQTQMGTAVVDERDSISTWDFQSSHADDGPLEEGVRKEIARMEGLLGGDQSGANDDPTDYSLYVGIAGQYSLLGDGEKTLEYLQKALAIDSEKTGLAWHNVGALMERLGAINTARDAYANAVKAQKLDAYYVAYLQFLMKYFSEDFATVDAAFADGETVFGESAFFLLQMKAGWFTQSGRLDEAVAIWEKARSIASPEMQADIEREIRRLKQQSSKKLEG